MLKNTIGRTPKTPKMGLLVLVHSNVLSPITKNYVNFFNKTLMITYFGNLYDEKALNIISAIC